MNIGEMHVMFRQFAQQMGMQNVRAILPEQIDLLINTSIGDTVNQLIASSIGATNDRIITDNSKILQINSLKTLYKTDIINVTPSNGFKFKNRDYYNGKFSIDMNSLKDTVTYVYWEDDKGDFVLDSVTNEYRKATTGDESVKHFSRKVSASSKVFPEYLFLVDFSINYSKVISGTWKYTNDGNIYSSPTLNEDDFISNIYPIRLIDEAFLADTLNDFILKPSLRSPVMVIVNNKAELYIGSMIKSSDGCLCKNNLSPYEFRMSYIAKPKTVCYGADLGIDNVDCDLPENLHIDIVKHAVDLYRQALAISQPMQQPVQQPQQDAQETRTQRQNN